MASTASNSYLPGFYNPLPTSASSNLQSRRIPPYSSGPLPTASTASQPPSLILPASMTTPMGPILPLTSYDLGEAVRKPTLSSGVSQPLSSNTDLGGGHCRAGPVPTRRSNFSNTLPSPRRRQQMKELLEAQQKSKDDSSPGVKPQNVSSSRDKITCSLYKHFISWMTS